MIILKKITKNSVPCYVLLDYDGSTKIVSVEMLKEYMRTKSINIENATLKGDRLYINKDVKVPTKPKTLGYKRTPLIQSMSDSEKYNYYFDVILKNSYLVDMSRFTIDELDCILVGSWILEINDNGSSTVDMMLHDNLYIFSGINSVIRECIRRNYLTEDECRQYLLGSDSKGRICNRCTFAEWILEHKK